MINIFGTNAKHLLRTKFLMILIATAFGKNVPNMVLGAKAVALNMQQNFSKNVGETE